MQGHYNEDVSDIYDKVGRAIDRVCAAADGKAGSRLEEVVVLNAEATKSPPATGAKARAAFAPAHAQVKWRVPTVAEGGNPTSTLGLTSLLEQHGKTLEDHCRSEILQPALKEIRWGDADAPAARGGLRELVAAQEASAGKAPRYLGAIGRGMDLCATLGTAASRSLLRRGTTHTAVTTMMAREFARALGDGDDDEGAPVPAPDLDGPLGSDVDHSFAQRFGALTRKSAHPGVLHCEQGPSPAKGGDSRAGKAANGGKVSRPGGKSGAMARRSLMDDIAFEMDTAFLKLKERDLIDADQDLGPSSAGVLEVRASYFLKFTVREALYLPKMCEKDSYADAYCRCSLQSNKSILSGPKGHCRCETKCIWNSRDPIWDQEFVFTFTSKELGDHDISLIIELFDVNLGKHGMDNKIGHVDITVFRERRIWMPTEAECEEIYKILDAAGESVRCNNGVLHAEKLGRHSVIRIKTFLSTRPELQPALCASLIQQNVRCFLARRKVGQEKAAIAALMDGCKLGVVQSTLQVDLIWDVYLKSCATKCTTAIRTLKDQIGCRVFRLIRYAATIAGIRALGELCSVLVKMNELHCLSLIAIGLRGRSLAILLQLLPSGASLHMLALDQNLISSDSADDTSECVPTKDMQGISALAHFVRSNSTLNVLSLSRTCISSRELAEIVLAASENSALQVLNLGGNMQNQRLQSVGTSNLLANMLGKNTNLIEFNYNDNGLQFQAAETLLRGCVSMFMRRLHLRSTGIGKSERALHYLAQFLERPDCRLDYLDLSNCNINTPSALLLSQSVQKNSSLQILVLDGNLLGEIGYFSFIPKNGRATIMVDWTKELVGRDSSVNRGVQTQICTLYEKFIEFQCNCPSQIKTNILTEWLVEMSVKDALLSINELRFKLMAAQTSGERFQAFYHWFMAMMATLNSQFVMVSVNDCGFDDCHRSVNTSDPFGKYYLNMSLARSRSTLLHLMKLAYSGIGCFDHDSTLHDFDFTTKDLVIRQYTIDVNADVSLWSFPNYGFMRVKLIPNSLQEESSKKGNNLHTSTLKDFEERIAQTVGSDARIQIINRHFCHGKSRYGYSQAISILRTIGRLSNQDESRRLSLMEERLAVVVSAFNSVLVPSQRFQLLDHLNSEERIVAEERLGIMPFAFAPNNLTGYYRLNLSKMGSRDRDIASHLLARRKRVQTLLTKRLKQRKGGGRADVELMWRNAQISIFTPLGTVTEDVSMKDLTMFQLPAKGVLSMDFVDVCDKSELRRKHSRSRPMETDKFSDILKKLRNLGTASKVLVEIRQLSNDNFFTCLQVVALLEIFPVDSISRYARVEVAVCLFSCILDWRGFRHVIRHVGAAFLGDIDHRLGRVNIYCDEVVSPVGWWRLDLKVDEDRWLMQELVHLAHIEPGNAFLDFALDDCTFNVPLEWLIEVPTEQVATFFYCRSKVVIERCMLQGSWTELGDSDESPWPASFPPDFQVPPLPSEFEDSILEQQMQESRSAERGFSWVELEKIRIVADTLRSGGSHAEAMFAKIDLDAGGEISRSEFSQGMLTIGAWLPPDQLRLLFSVIDNDRSGDISAVEFYLFWIHAPPLRLHDHEQEAYWKARGIVPDVYKAFVRLYDVRSWYPVEEVMFYGMENARFSLIDEPTLMVKTIYDSSAMRLVSILVRPRHRAVGDKAGGEVEFTSPL